MLIDTSVTIAYKCTSCGSYEFIGLSLFAVLYKKKISYSCHCRSSAITVMQQGEKTSSVRIPCFCCGGVHVLPLPKKALIRGETAVFHCPENGMQIGFIGGDEAVRNKVDRLEEEFDELIDMFGYESYFDNTQVMLDTLNRIHDIAQRDNLSCECGNNDIELVLKTGDVILWCRSCGSIRKIPAASNTDLKELLKESQIIIPCGHILSK